jgi:hypothetical protein
VDVRNKNLFRDMLDAKNSKPNSETKVSQNGRTFYSKTENYVPSGTRQRMCRCLTTSKTKIVLKELHEGVVGKHFVVDNTAKKILNVRYWLPTLFKDTHEFCKSCDGCQKVGGLKTKSLAKLVRTLPKEPFMKLGLDFISPIKLVRRVKGKKYILVAIDYAIKWVEAKTFITNIAIVIAKFLYEYILTRFGCPLTIIIDQGVHFINDNKTSNRTIFVKAC